MDINGRISFQFFILQTPTVIAELEEYEILLRGQGEAPPGNWKVSLSSLPQEGLRDTLKLFAKLETSEGRLSFFKGVKDQLSQDLQYDVFVCTRRGAMGTSLECECTDHAMLDPDMFKIIMGNHKWVCWLDQFGKSKVVFRLPVPDKLQDLRSPAKWAKVFDPHTLYGSGCIPPGHWEVKLSRIPELLTTTLRAEAKVKDFLAAVQGFRVMTSKDDQSPDENLFYTVASHLPEQDSESTGSVESLRSMEASFGDLSTIDEPKAATTSRVGKLLRFDTNLVRWCRLSCKCFCHGSEGMVLENDGGPDFSSTKEEGDQILNLSLVSNPEVAKATTGEQDQALKHCKRCSSKSRSNLEQSSPEDDDSPKTSTPVRVRRNAQAGGPKSGQCLTKTACQHMDPLIEEDFGPAIVSSEVVQSDPLDKEKSEK